MCSAGASTSSRSTARAQAGVWQATLAGRELTGEVSWRSQGKGKVIARMKNLDDSGGDAATARRAVADKDQPLELPALDINADNFQVRQTNLGKLELTRGTRRARLEARAAAHHQSGCDAEHRRRVAGLAHAAAHAWSTCRLDVNDIGKFLVALGYPEGVRRGTAKLEGPLVVDRQSERARLPDAVGQLRARGEQGPVRQARPGHRQAARRAEPAVAAAAAVARFSRHLQRRSRVRRNRRHREESTAASPTPRTSASRGRRCASR